MLWIGPVVLPFNTRTQFSTVPHHECQQTCDIMRRRLPYRNLVRPRIRNVDQSDCIHMSPAYVETVCEDHAVMDTTTVVVALCYQTR